MQFNSIYILFFSEKSDHKAIENLIIECPNYIVTMKKYFEDYNRKKFEEVGLSIANNIFELRQKFRRYLKIEWDRAKNNE